MILTVFFLIQLIYLKIKALYLTLNRCTLVVGNSNQPTLCFADNIFSLYANDLPVSQLPFIVCLLFSNISYQLTIANPFFVGNFSWGSKAPQEIILKTYGIEEMVGLSQDKEQAAQPQRNLQVLRQRANRNRSGIVEKLYVNVP